ncbi:MAG: hypothetical protein ACE5I2_02345, partial [Anaerolineae bacterium]
YVVGPPSRHVSGAIYKWVDPAAEILAATPDQLPPRSSPEVDPADVQFSTDGTKRPDLSRWNLSDRILGLIYQPLPVGQRSEADMSVIVALVAAGATDDQIRSVFLHYPIGRAGKYADKGKYADRYLGHSIGKARSYVRAKVNERLDVWEQKLEGQDWKGRAGKTDLSVAGELLNLARQRDSLTLPVSTHQMSELAGIGEKAAARAFARLEERGLIYRVEPTQGFHPFPPISTRGFTTRNSRLKTGVQARL